MSSFIGKDGSVTFSGTAYSAAGSLCVQSYTVDINCNIDQYSCMASTGNWGLSLAGTKTWGATVETSYDDAIGADVASTIGASVTCSFESTDGLEFTGTALISGIGNTINGDARNTQSWTLIGTGTLAEA